MFLPECCCVLYIHVLVHTWSNKPNLGYSSSGSLLPGSGCSFTRKTSRSLLWKIHINTKTLPNLHNNNWRMWIISSPWFWLCCWATWAFLVSGVLSCTPSTCQWMVWCPAMYLNPWANISVSFKAFAIIQYHVHLNSTQIHSISFVSHV